MKPSDSDTPTYSLAELREFKARFDDFFDYQADERHEHKINARRSGWTAHFHLARPLPSVTDNLLGVAQVVNPAFVAQLVDQLIDEMETKRDGHGE